MVCAMSTQRQTNMVVFVRAGRLLPLLISFNLISDGVCQSVFLSCPEQFADGLIAEVYCSVNNLAVQPPACFDAPDIVQFSYQSTSGPRELCRTPYPGSCSQPPTGGNNCSCVKSDAGINTYQLNFLADKATYGTVNLTCSINCTPSPTYGSNTTCVPINYKQTSSPTLLSHTADYTSGSTLPSSVTEESDTGQGTHTDLIVGLAVGLGGGVIGSGIGGVIFYKKFVANKKANKKQQTADTSNTGTSNAVHQ